MAASGNSVRKRTRTALGVSRRPKGVPFHFLQAWRGREWELVISPLILDEVRRVLSLPRLSLGYGPTGEAVRDLSGLLQRRATGVAGRLPIPRTAPHPDDDHVLACAKEGLADSVVSGDRALLGLGRFEAIPIVTPARFAATFRAAR